MYIIIWKKNQFLYTCVDMSISVYAAIISRIAVPWLYLCCFGRESWGICLNCYLSPMYGCCAGYIHPWLISWYQGVLFTHLHSYPWQRNSDFPPRMSWHRSKSVEFAIVLIPGLIVCRTWRDKSKRPKNTISPMGVRIQLGATCSGVAYLPLDVRFFWGL